MERDIHENCHKRKAAGARHPKIREKKSEMEIDLKKVLQQSSKVAKKKKKRTVRFATKGAVIEFEASSPGILRSGIG